VTRQTSRAATVLALVASLGFVAPLTSGAAPTRPIFSSANARALTRCPWVAASREGLATPVELADEVIAKMTLAQKAAFVSLRNGNGVENFNTGVPSLCIPPLTLSDGPSGLAGLLTRVTQLPAPLGVAASFDPSLAEAVGRVLGAEARTKGIDVVQAPDLNLARVPLGGRNFETLGEDPLLSGDLGAAEVQGIQSEGVMALVKHFTAYTQETARARLDQDVTARALAEVYDAPFQAAVQDAHPAAVMCSTGLLNGVRDCDNAELFATLRAWGFKGFIRSDLRAVPDAAPAFEAGLDLLKSASTPSLLSLARSGELPVKDLNRAAQAILTEMFAFGLVARPRGVHVHRAADTPAHAAVALRAAEESAVLLKNAGDVLPLLARGGSVAIIGSDALAPLTAGRGSSHVIAPFVLTPLTFLRSALGAKVTITYSPGEPATLNLGGLHGASLVSKTTLPAEPPSHAGRDNGGADLTIEAAANVTNAIITAGRPGVGRGWSHWRATVRVRRSGEYEVSVRDVGDAWFSLDGQRIISSPGIHAPVDSTTLVKLRAGRRYTFSARWFTVIRQQPPSFGLVDVTPAIDAAVRAARNARVALVFADEPSTEGADQGSFNLPGDENLLIQRVAAANPRTVVILNTANPVLMPWLKDVRAVLEMWFPGEEDGRALAALLTGRVDPSGRLPVTFPASPLDQPTATAKSFPGVDDVVDFGAGRGALDIGYRWYEAHGVAPLFAFGDGLDYTTFRFSSFSVRHTGQSVAASVDVTNTGRRSGVEVAECYVRFPPAAHEPPEQLKAFARVRLAPGATRRVTLEIPTSALEVFTQGRWHLVAGDYLVAVGASSQDLPLRRAVALG
jgi:beta-glucosidase